MFAILVLIGLTTFVIGWNLSRCYYRECTLNKIYPPYYKTVTITYKFPGKQKEITEAWLSVNDIGEYIWTLEDNLTVISDEYVIDWKE